MTTPMNDGDAPGDAPEGSSINDPDEVTDPHDEDGADSTEQGKLDAPDPA